MVILQIKQAIVLRMQDICNEKSIRFNELANRSGVTPSTVYSMMDSRRKDLSVSTLKKLCDGLEISIPDFFDSDIFKNLEQEMK
ncbi:MAG: helix-turn-helix domain-containing protein [Acutalibacteraceae bacterium]